MKYGQTTILVPSHGLEDFPVDLPEDEAAGLLNSFAVAWHPQLIAQSESIPDWCRADAPPDNPDQHVVVIPATIEGLLPQGWKDAAKAAGAIVVGGASERPELLSQLPIESDSVAADLIADFQALGTAWLMTELLARRMHHFSTVDEVRFRSDAVSAANAAVAGDDVASRQRLGFCFEQLLEVRERFYPTACSLIDLCLLAPDTADSQFDQALQSGFAMNVIARADDLERIARDRPEVIEQLRRNWDSGSIELLGGEKYERPVPLMTVESLLWDYREGRDVFRRLFDRTPHHWARRRYGFSTLLPQILTRHGQVSALHVAIDDGIYPDSEFGRVRWEGSDGTLIDALSRIPLAADSATSFLRFPTRLAESMQEDPAAVISLARWPEVVSPWISDFQRISRYAPCFGRFVTLTEFLDSTASSGRLSSPREKDYLSPFLIQAVAGEEDNPVSRFRDHLHMRHRLDAGLFASGLADAIRGSVSAADELRRLEYERAVELSGPDPDEAQRELAEACLNEFLPAAAESLSRIIMDGAGDHPGCLIVNPLSFRRRVSIQLPAETGVPSASGAIRALQLSDDCRLATVDVPGCGYVWIGSGDDSCPKETNSGPPLADNHTLRNEFFEVMIHGETGGIERIREYGRKPNRLSQRLAFRFPRERTIGTAHDDVPDARSWYSDMRCRSIKTTSAGPAMAEMETLGDLIDQVTNQSIAEFRQKIRVWRSRPVVELDIELTDIKRLPEGDPWSNYFASRFAWNDSTASLTRSVLQQAHGFENERFESPWFLEIASNNDRTTIVNHGLPFHRRTGPRMVDSILLTAGEQARRFRFTIVVDNEYPMQAALDAMVEPIVLGTANGPPVSGSSGWFFNVTPPNVQLTRIMSLMPTNVHDMSNEAAQSTDSNTEDPGKSRSGFAVRLLETEGRRCTVTLKCFRTPGSARQRDFLGRTIRVLSIQNDAVTLDMKACEIADVELYFDQ